MGQHVLFTCDYHDADGCEGSSTLENTAYEGGWAVFERRWHGEKVFPAIPGTGIQELRLAAAWHTDMRHVCSHCLREPDCHDWLIGWKVEPTSDSKRNLERATEQLRVVA